jgi:hypothetical protein
MIFGTRPCPAFALSGLRKYAQDHSAYAATGDETLLFAASGWLHSAGISRR